jgi:branched-chain amino acid transport system substrate-binding protein
MIVYSPDTAGGYSMINAAAMIQDELNTSNGLNVDGTQYQIKIVTLIIDKTPEAAVTAAQKLINQEGVVAIIGPAASALAIPAGEVAERAKIPLLSPVSSNPATTKGRRYVFRMGFVDDFQGKVDADFAYSQLKARTAAVLYEIDDPYSSGIATVFRDRFVANGGKIISFENFTVDKPDYTNQLETIKAQTPDVLFLPTNDPPSIQAQVIQARKMGIQAQLLGPDSWDQYAFPAVPEFDQTYMTANWDSAAPDHNGQVFTKTYQQRFNVSPGDTAVLTYDAFKIVMQAMTVQKAITPQAIRDGLYTLPSYEGAGGSIKFSDSGDPIRSAVILKLGRNTYSFFAEVKPQ